MSILSTANSTAAGPREEKHLSALASGARLKNYMIAEMLGAGGFGITYKAREDVTDRQVAIKEYLPTALAARDTDGATVRPLSSGAARDFDWGLERFRQEAKLLIEFRHPNIVPVLSYFEANGTGYIVMEFQEGTSLAEILRERQTLSESQLLEFMMPLLDGVEEVHSHNLLHRDIKPENIFIRRDGTPLLLDFGSARRALGERSGKFTALLTEGYAPFEQYAGTENQGPWSDVYALSAVMFRSLVGEAPAGAPLRATAKLIGKPDPLARDLAALRATLSSDIAFAIEAGLRVVDKERPQTIAAFRELMVPPRSITPGIPIFIAGSGATTLIPDLAQAPAADHHALALRAASRQTRSRAIRDLIGGAIICAAASGAIYFGQQTDWFAQNLRSTGSKTVQSLKIALPEKSGRLLRKQTESARPFPEEAQRKTEFRRPETDDQPRIVDPDIGQRKNLALLEYQQKHLDRLEEERRQIQASIRAADAERQRRAEAEPKKNSGPSELRLLAATPPPAEPRPLNPFRIFRLW